VKNILLLDSEGKRVAVKYFSYDWPSNASKLAYEKSVFTKTLKANARTEGSFILSIASSKINHKFHGNKLSSLNYVASSTLVTLGFMFTPCFFSSICCV
jgi:hypothetical protein